GPSRRARSGRPGCAAHASLPYWRGCNLAGPPAPYQLSCGSIHPRRSPPKRATASPPTGPGSTRKRVASVWRAWRAAPGAGTATPDSAPDTTSSPSAPVDPSRVESARRTVLYRAPEGQPAGTLAPSAPLRVLGRSGDWTRVELEGWVKSADLEIAPPGVLVGITAAELRTDPQRYAGQVLRWTLQFISTQQADELRPEIPNGAT